MDEGLNMSINRISTNEFWTFTYDSIRSYKADLQKAYPHLLISS
jgi:hypothetical protein